MEPRTQRVHLGLLGFGVVLYLWGFVGQSSLAALPPGTADRLVEFPVTFGGVSAGSYEEVRFLAEGHPPGREVNLGFPSGEVETITLPNAYSVPYLLVTLLSGVLFLWISGFLFGPRANNAALKDLMTGTWAYGLAVMIGGVYFPKTPWTPDLIRGIAQLTLLAVLPVIFLHLACVFPRPMPGLRRFEWMFIALLGLALALVGWQETAFLAYFRAPGPGTFAGLGTPQTAADVVLVAEVALGLLVLGGRCLTEKRVRERSLLRWLLAGFAVGLTPYVFLRTLPELLDADFQLPQAYDRIFEFAIPLAVVFVIIRNRFLDIDVVVRRRLLYTAVVLALFLVGLAAVGLLGRSLDPAFRTWHWLPVLGLGLVAGMLFMPLREWIGCWIDQRFFHIRHDTAEILARFNQRLDHAKDQTEIARATCEFLQETVVLDRTGMILKSGEVTVIEICPEAKTSHAGMGDALASFSHHSDRTLIAAPGFTDSPPIEDPGYPENLVEIGFPVVATLAVPPRSEAMILLGAKRSGRHLVGPDLQIVTEAAAAVEFALARMHLVQEAERAQIKDRFLSRVAHDLRTPLTSIGWSVRNLLDGVAGDLTDSQREYLAGMRTSTDYLGRLIENLLEMGRLERGQVRLDLVAHDIRKPVEDAVETVRPIARVRGVQIAVEAPNPVQVHADPEKVTEIAVNLLENAVRFSPDGKTVRVDIRGDPPGFTVSDEGSGLGDEDPERLFARFEQGGRSPYAGEHGFGLGLHIVSSYVGLMGGRVTAANRPEGGARFTVLFPAPGSSEEA